VKEVLVQTRKRERGLVDEKTASPQVKARVHARPNSEFVGRAASARGLSLD
jgi:hypothetical protein